MSTRDVTRWIAPPPGVSRSASAFRVWRWADDDHTRLSLLGHRPGSPDDPCVIAPGFLQPGLALVDGAGSAWCALGRHPRIVADHVYDEALLVPSVDGSWQQRGVARTDRTTTTLIDSTGALKAQRRRATGWRKEPIDPADRLAVGGRTLRLEPVLVGGAKGFWSFLSPPECVGVRWLDEATGALVVEATTEGLPGWRGDVTHPVMVRWSVEPDPWSRAAMLLLLGSMIDLSDGIHTD